MQESALKERPKAHSRRRVVIPAWEDTNFTSYALGGKGHGIARLMALGLPTPPALVISTSLARSHQETGEFPKRFMPQLERELEALETVTGKRFGDPQNPLLVSVRSGAMISMPGMMETVLNVGLTATVGTTLAARFGASFVEDCRRHLREGLGAYCFDLADSTAKEQLLLAIKSVLNSWQSPRAQAYRREHGIDDQLGTAITIQAMVFGNQVGIGESGTGVVMSHHPDTAEPMLYGNYLPSAQGHDLVSGETTPDAIEVLLERKPEYATQLSGALALLESEVGGPVEVEFTIENGTLYFLQFRKEKLSPEATIKYLVREKHAGRLTRAEVVDAVPEWMVENISVGAVLRDNVESLQHKLLARGTGVGNAAACGGIATTDEDVEFCKSFDIPYILVREATTPDDFELMLGAAGIVTKEGGTTCHAAVVARHQGIPAVIGLGDAFDAVANSDRLVATAGQCTIDPASGSIYLGELELVEPTIGKEVALFLKWRPLSKPVIDPALCLEMLSPNTALNNFYMAEAMLADCSDQALAAKIRAVHVRLTRKTAAVFSTYLALAVASEVTHADSRYERPRAAAMLHEMQQRFTLKHRNSWGRSVVPEIATELSALAPEEVANFFRDSKQLFSTGEWEGAVGGQRWADIAAVGEQYWRGEISTNIFIDRVFDLRHNTGRVFNKHPMVSANYSARNLDRQLDDKRRELTVWTKWEELAYHHSDIDSELLDFIEGGQRKGMWK